jgi:hypothetical protein
VGRSITGQGGAARAALSSPLRCPVRSRFEPAAAPCQRPTASRHAPAIARAAPQHLSPSLGEEVSYRTYAADCRLYIPGAGVNWQALRGTVWDEFVIAHTLGWWAKVRRSTGLAEAAASLLCRMGSGLATGRTAARVRRGAAGARRTRRGCGCCRLLGPLAC